MAVAEVSPAHDAARDGDVAKLRLLPHAALSAADQNGWTPAHSAADNGHEGCLRALHELGGAAAASLSAAAKNGKTPAHCAASNGHEGCLRVLHELGGAAAASLSAASQNGWTPAHHAAFKGHEGCLRVLHELGGAAAASLSAANQNGWTPAHRAANEGHEGCLRVLHELGGAAAASLSAVAQNGETPAHRAAFKGHEGCLRVLHELGGAAAASLSAADQDGLTPAHLAADNGHEGCLRVLHELGGAAAASLSAADQDGFTPAHCAAEKGHEGCLRALHELGGAAAASLSAADQNGWTPAHRAANEGHEGCLRALHELGGAAAASLSAATQEGQTPAHWAADNGHEGCLRVLHELACQTADPLLSMLETSGLANAPQCIAELRARRSLSWTQSTSPFDKVDFQQRRVSAAYAAAQDGHVGCFRFLSEIGGASAFLEQLRGDASLLDSDSGFPCLLTDPALLDLETKRSWLDEKLGEKVDDDDFDASLNLEVHRGRVLEGVCAQLGVEEQTGRVQAEARGVRVTFQGEAADGDALRREWLGAASAEMIDPACGLFLSKDGGRTLQPNPESGSTHGADHLSYFALLGRIAGLALYHREQLDVAWSPAFLKAVLGSPMTVDDVASADPEAGDNLRKMRGYTAEELEACGVTFEIDSDESVVYDDSAKRRRTSIELKPGGAEIEVTRENLEEYLALRTPPPRQVDRGAGGRRARGAGRLRGRRGARDAAQLLHGGRVPAAAVRHQGGRRRRLAGLGAMRRRLHGGVGAGGLVLGGGARDDTRGARQAAPLLHGVGARARHGLLRFDGLPGTAAALHHRARPARRRAAAGGVGVLQQAAAAGVREPRDAGREAAARHLALGGLPGGGCGRLKLEQEQSEAH